MSQFVKREQLEEIMLSFTIEVYNEEDIEFINAITDYFDALVAIFESIMNCEYSEAAFDNLPDIIANIDSNYPALS